MFNIHYNLKIRILSSSVYRLSVATKYINSGKYISTKSKGLRIENLDIYLLKATEKFHTIRKKQTFTEYMFNNLTTLLFSASVSSRFIVSSFS